MYQEKFNIETEKRIVGEDLDTALRNKMSRDLFSLPAERGLKSSYKRLMDRKEELTSQEQQQLTDSTEALQKIAETATYCDHGTIGDRWTYGILMEAFKMKQGAWVLCKHDIHQRSISVEDAERLCSIETMYPNTG